MTKEQVKELIGQFGELTFNGKFYPSKIYGTIARIEGKYIIFERLEGLPMKITIAGIKKFKAKRLPKGIAV